MANAALVCSLSPRLDFTTNTHHDTVRLIAHVRGWTQMAQRRRTCVQYLSSNYQLVYDRTQPLLWKYLHDTMMLCGSSLFCGLNAL